MYTFSNRLRIASFILMAVGVIGIAIGFISAPSTVEEAKAIVAQHDGGHGEAHAAPAVEHHQATDTHMESNDHQATATHDAGHDASHDAHLLQQLQNKPWAAVYVAALFFLFIALGVLAFYGINRAAQAGWSLLLFRVMEGITAYLVPGGIIVFVLLAMSVAQMNHLFVWLDPEVVAHDKLIQGKSGYLNGAGLLIRAAIFIGGWVAYRTFSRKWSLAQDKASDYSNFVKNFRLSAGFLVFFLISESMMSWDWVMSVDPHWFSTLFGWYVFATMFVSAVTVLALITIYLKSKGYLQQVNNSHIHDLAKFMFAFSIFWTYLWFSQFMLIWYSNIPEEVTYFVTRIQDFKLSYFLMIAINFVLPVLLLINSDFKRINWLVIMTGLIILFGHYLDVYHMIVPATVGDQSSIGLTEISALLFFAGLFIFVVFTELTKAPLTPENNPLIEESKHFHY